MIFKKGLQKVFFAPFTFFTPDPIHLPNEFDGSVEEAWNEVGQLLHDVMDEQGQYIEQKTGKKPKAISRGKRKR